MITGINRPLLTLTFLALIATNILTLTSTAFNAALSGLMGTALGIRTVSSIMQSKIASRTKRVAAKSIAAIPAESIPFLGVAVLIADTGYELYAACETVTDLDQLYSDLGMDDETSDDALHSVCNPGHPILCTRDGSLRG
jgi:hypothetical protein